jgi:hypothetical protein
MASSAGGGPSESPRPDIKAARRFPSVHPYILHLIGPVIASPQTYWVGNGSVSEPETDTHALEEVTRPVVSSPAQSRTAMSRVVESLEVMLDVYRQKCVTQSAEIERLKQSMEESLIHAVRVPAKPAAGSTKAAPRADSTLPTSSHSASRMYLEEIAEELERVLEKNEQLERGMARLQRRLDVEEAWRTAVMEFMEVDERMHEMVRFEKASPKRASARDKSKKTGGPPMASHQSALRAALAKTRRLERSVRADV